MFVVFQIHIVLSFNLLFCPKGRNWNRERELNDRDQLLSMRFTTNAEAAKGKKI